ncbi:hypothetical protein Glove_116g36 [Diversispora epigaea]|uniref:3-dehydrosphinganine reductase n=1 Tax=Diversispora epigaea TaxID=1348612 RepID=A0A397J167_9GLOM|nr:hypothetical protein Glove_116g36 [Diversispora epigaea]
MSLIDYILQFTPYSKLSGNLHPIASVIVTLLIAIVSYIMVNSFMSKILGRNQFNPQGKHVYITGGSRGLGKAIGKMLAAKGAHITICALNEKALDIALEEIKGAARHRNDYSQLIFNSVSADLTKNEESIRALDEASAKHNGRVPDIIFCNAGSCIPKVFIEQPIEDFEYMMQLNYFGALYTAHKAAKLMAQQGVKGKIIFVSSLAALVGIMGYSAYTPSKLALRGLTECLRQELILYDIGVHCFFPGNMDTDGLSEENKTKPQLTKKIEGDDKQTPEQAAKSLYKGLCKGNVFITSDLLGDAIRASTLGFVEANNGILDSFLCLMIWIVSKPARLIADKFVRDGKSEYSVIPADN